MKSLLFGIVLILLIGVAGFFYRNVMETEPLPEPVACTMDAKMCPDGSAVGRTGPSCEFAACPLPNAEFNNEGVSFVIPEGYSEAQNIPEGDGVLVASYAKLSLSESVSHRIIVRSFPIAEGETGEEVILAKTRYQPADMQAEDFERFETETIDGNEFRITVIERFEALVQSAYFLMRSNDVLVFEVTEHDVMGWMEPELEVNELPEHTALREMLETLQVSGAN